MVGATLGSLVVVALLVVVCGVVSSVRACLGVVWSGCSGSDACSVDSSGRSVVVAEPAVVPGLVLVSTVVLSCVVSCEVEGDVTETGEDVLVTCSVMVDSTGFLVPEVDSVNLDSCTPIAVGATLGSLVALDIVVGFSLDTCTPVVVASLGFLALVEEGVLVPDVVPGVMDACTPIVVGSLVVDDEEEVVEIVVLVTSCSFVLVPFVVDDGSDVVALVTACAIVEVGTDVDSVLLTACSFVVARVTLGTLLVPDDPCSGFSVMKDEGGRVAVRAGRVAASVTRSTGARCAAGVVVVGVVASEAAAGAAVVDSADGGVMAAKYLLLLFTS